MGGGIEQLAGVADQPLIAHAFLANHKQVQVVRLVLVQTEILDAIGSGRQLQLLVHLQIRRCGAQQSRLLGAGLGRGNQQFILVLARIQAVEVAGVLGQTVTAGIQ